MTEPRTDPTTRRYLSALAGGEIRTATYDGDPHLVVPVVALVGDSVIRPVGSAGPEFVPAAVLASMPAGWNGRPVMADHPDGGRSSANAPRTLELYQFGQMFNTRFEDGKLKAEAWVNTAKAAKAGGIARQVVDRLESGEQVEVSVAAYVTADQRAGTTDKGEHYEFIWLDATPDHLAMLPAGAEGACSIDMGCGAPRANRQGDDMATKEAHTMKVSVDASELDKSADKLTFAARVLSGVLETLGIPSGPDDTETVGTTTTDVVTSDTETTTAASGDCGCSTGDGHAAPTETKGAAMGCIKELVGRLIASERSPFTEEDREHLEALGEAKVTALEEALQPPAAPEPVVEPEPEPDEEDEEATKSEEEWMAEAPESLRAMVERYQGEETARRSSLVTSLGGAQDEYTTEQLEAKSTDDLQALAKLLKVGESAPDFSGKGSPITDDVAAPPKPYTLALANRAN
jgi:hypothetical protein